MPVIRANRDSVDDRFSVLGFTIRSESPLFEVGIATDPELFHAERRGERSRRNFFSSRAVGALRARRGEAVYLVPPEVMHNFLGQSKLYFGLATYPENSGGVPNFVQTPTAGNMYVNIAGLTERGLRRLLGRGLTNGGTGSDASLYWGGDANGHPMPSTPPAAPGAAVPPKMGSDSPVATPAAYDDGYGDWPSATPGPGSRTVRSESPFASAQELLVRDYDAGHGLDGLLAQLRFFAETVSWFAGVAVTTSFPHSAICQVRRPAGDGDSEMGTAFFIAPNLLLTAAHVVQGQTRLIIVPGKNGAGRGAEQEPFGRFVVPAADWIVHESYQPSSRDFDLAVIRAPQAAPNGRYFDLLEELAESRPEGVVVCGYSMQSNQADRVSRLVNGLIDPNRQHLHAGAARRLPSDETFDYDIQTLPGASGSPVYWIESVAAPRVHLVGVHVAGASDTTNRGCRLTTHKIGWIAARAAEWGLAGAMGMSGTHRSGTGTGRVADSQVPAPLVRAQEVIAPFYDPRDPASVLTCQNDPFSQAREEWFVGVERTQWFPHSAICWLEMTDAAGRIWGGTGFYVGPNRILTCGHNLHGMQRVVVAPGKNGAEEPFGRFAVSAGGWRVSNRYPGAGSDFDLAVIDGVPLSAPNGEWFDFLRATPSDRLPVVVCGYSGASDAVPELTRAIDPDKQHLHGGYIRAQSNPEVVEYPLLTLHGASGSPVYHIRDVDGRRRALVAAVHVSGAPAASGVNRGCFITPAKIDWIEGRTAALSHAGHDEPAPAARALVIGPDDVEQARRYAPQWADLFNWTVPAAIETAVTGRGMRVQRIAEASGELNLDRYEVRATRLPDGWSDVSLLQQVRTHLNDFLDTDNSEFIPYAIGVDDSQWTSSSPAGTVFKIDIVGPDNAAVVASLVEDRRWRFTTIWTEWSGDHPVSGHREFGVRSGSDGATVFYTRGADRSTQGLGETLVFAGADHLWRSFQTRLAAWINDHGGSATVSSPFSERFHPRVVDILYGHGTVAQSLAGGSFAIHWDTTPYYPQSSTGSCWAASAAMVVAWRDGRIVSDQEIAEKVPVFNAYKRGLFPRERRQLVDAWDLVPEAPASYSIDDWRNLLEQYGPLYVDMTWDIQGGGHARVLVGMESEGAPDGADTVMFMHDPWPDTPGRIRLGFREFLALYEGRTGNSSELRYQILHAAAIPAQARRSTAAPFSLTLAAEADGTSDTRTARPALPAPPAPLVQQQQLPAQAMTGPAAAVEIASVIAGAAMERLANNSGDIAWELDQLRGFKHPNDAAPSPMPPAQDGNTIQLTEWPYVENHLGDRISAGFEINWQHNGKSVGNVLISNIATNDAVGWGLSVKAKIMDDNIVYPRDNPTFAALRVRFEYCFRRAVGSDSIAIQDIHLFGNGRYNVSGRWTQD